MENAPVQQLADYLEGTFRHPVIDQTALGGNFDIHLRWNEKSANHPNLEALKQKLSDELGLELVPGRVPMQVLVVEKAK